MLYPDAKDPGVGSRGLFFFLAGIFLDGGKPEVGGTDGGATVGRGRGGGSGGLVPGFFAC